MRFTIVKHAGSLWNYYWLEDPKDGVDESSSAFFSHSGKMAGVELSYSIDDLPLAEQHCKKLNESNPCGDYAICPVKEANEQK